MKNLGQDMNKIKGQQEGIRNSNPGSSDRMSLKQNDAISSNYSDLPVSISSSIDLNKDYREEAKQIAIQIFFEYLMDEAEFSIYMDDVMRTNIYQKFGIGSISPLNNVRKSPN